MTQHTIIDKNGQAFIGDDLLFVRGPEGDVAIVKPMPVTKDERNDMFMALYAYRQCESLFEDGDTIHLPDGTEVAQVVGIEVHMEI
jgi:hypothetical protein